MKAKMGIEVNPDNWFPCVCDYYGFDDIRAAIGSMVEFAPYPTQLKKPQLTVCMAENGVYMPLAYNRWGIVGTFCIVKQNRRGDFLSMTEKEAEAVLHDLLGSHGYLDPACLTLNVFREPFAKYGEPPMGAVPKAGKWFA